MWNILCDPKNRNIIQLQLTVTSSVFVKRDYNTISSLFLVSEQICSIHCVSVMVTSRNMCLSLQIYLVIQLMPRYTHVEWVLSLLRVREFSTVTLMQIKTSHAKNIILSEHKNTHTHKGFQFTDAETHFLCVANAFTLHTNRVANETHSFHLYDIALSLSISLAIFIGLNCVPKLRTSAENLRKMEYFTVPKNRTKTSQQKNFAL